MKEWFDLRSHPLHDDLLDSPVGPMKVVIPLQSPITNYNPPRLNWKYPRLGGQFEIPFHGTLGVIKGAATYSMADCCYHCSVDLCFSDQTVSRTWKVRDMDLTWERKGLHDEFTEKIQEAYREYKGTPYPLLGETVN